MHAEFDRRSCTVLRTGRYAKKWYVWTSSRYAAALLGRFLPRLGPFASRAALLSLEVPLRRMWPDSYAPQEFCNAKRIGCILCAAHLDFARRDRRSLVGPVALLGRFLPRLGPHGSPRGPFYFSRRANEFTGFEGSSPGLHPAFAKSTMGNRTPSKAWPGDPRINQPVYCDAT